MYRRQTFLTASLWLVLSAAPAWAIIFNHTADTAHNTSAPTGAYQDSGWQWMGAWFGGNGIAVDQHHFITANHFGTPAAGELFTLTDGSTYSYHSHVDDPQSDLRVVRVNEPFSSWAPLYTNSNESGKLAVLYGRGRTRGEPVDDKGWKWSSAGVGTMRWGTNVVTEYADYEDQPSGVDQLLRLAFDRLGNVDATDEEAHLAAWDSGGGMFINDAGVWKLAGVNYSVDGPFDVEGDGGANDFDAALVDRGGFYEAADDDQWNFIPDEPQDNPSAAYGTRISQRIDFIATAVPEPSTVLLLVCGLLCAIGLAGLRRRP